MISGFVSSTGYIYSFLGLSVGLNVGDYFVAQLNNVASLGIQGDMFKELLEAALFAARIAVEGEDLSRQVVLLLGFPQVLVVVQCKR